MKNKSVLVILAVCLFGLTLWLGGCNAASNVCKIGDWSQPGETEAEGHIRHMRNMRINQQNLMRDLDEVFHLDRPSKFTELRAP